MPLSSLLYHECSNPHIFRAMVAPDTARETVLRYSILEQMQDCIRVVIVARSNASHIA